MRTKVGDVAQGRYYYDFLGDGDNQSLEKLFSTIESEISKIFNSIELKVRNDITLDLSDKKAIIGFLKLQLIRSDYMRSHISQDIIDKFFKEEFQSEANKLAHAYIIQQSLFEDDFLTGMLNYLMGYEILVLKAHQKIDMYTSSHPIFFHSSGRRSEILERLQKARGDEPFPQIQSNLFFPFSSKICFYFYDPNHITELDLNNWEGDFMAAGISWAGQRIYFRCNDSNINFFSRLKPLLKKLK
ncbi:DUF4238 domain-containing protein [Deinococcus sp. PESE-13]